MPSCFSKPLKTCLEADLKPEGSFGSSSPAHRFCFPVIFSISTLMTTSLARTWAGKSNFFHVQCLMRMFIPKAFSSGSSGIDAFPQAMTLLYFVVYEQASRALSIFASTS